VRPWQHVLEPLSGYLTLAEHLYRQGAKFEGGWNFGPSDSDAQPVSHLVAEMSRLWGPGADWQTAAEQSAVHEAHLLRLDSSKARTALHWGPRWTLDQALEKTVEWYKNFYSAGDHDQLQSEVARSSTLAQIKAYCLAAAETNNSAAGSAAP
jgi:CDP-glucose 4,6-dehydratase